MRDALFFSEVTLDLAGNGRPERGATEPYVVHQLVADLFGDYEHRPYLFRAEEGRDVRNTLLLSTRPPQDPADIPRRSFGRVRAVKTKPFAIEVPPGTNLDYEIRINATKDVPRDGQRSKRLDVWEAVWREDRDTDRTPADLYGEYLARKLEGVADIVSAHLTARGFVRVRRDLEHRRPIQFVAANLIGTLTVLDPAGLEHRVTAGIGRSKAFGCGLLCLSRPGTVLPRRYGGVATE